jgi:glycosyltransferase involved in cell wall biosynthesis
MNEPLLSVAVITYNQENYIAQTLGSIIEQEHDYSYEIIVGEDCSNDGTREVLLKYKEKYPDIIKLILNEKNLGLIKNYFNVIGHCTGKYIMECAGDDYWLPGKVVSQIQYMEEHPEAGMCYSKYKMVNDWNGHIEILPCEMNKQDVTFEKLMFANPIGALTVCLRRNLVSEYVNNIDPVNKNWIGEDMPMWRWFAYNSQIHPFDKVVAVYRCLETSVSHPKKFDKMEKIVDYRYELRMFYAELYKMPFLEDKINIMRIQDLIHYAAKYREYNKYRSYVHELPIQNIKSFIKRIVGMNKFLFLLYSKILFPSQKKKIFKVLI